MYEVQQRCNQDKQKITSIIHVEDLTYWAVDLPHEMARTPRSSQMNIARLGVLQGL
jgi:hypothetical protein